MDKLARYFSRVENSKSFSRKKLCQNKIGTFHLKHPVPGLSITLCALHPFYWQVDQNSCTGIPPTICILNLRVVSWS